jgi:hypothetical protein
LGLNMGVRLARMSMGPPKDKHDFQESLW